MNYNNSYLAWYLMFMRTPERTEQHKDAKTAEDALKLPGNCVKSHDNEEFGVLVIYGNVCVVRGHDSPVSPPFVWIGTKEEYHNMWEVD